MKSPKRITAILIAGFLAFAPPGTMIFLLALVIGLVGRRWAAAAVGICVAAGTAFLFLRRRSRLLQRRGGRPEHPESN
jgi:hypothetical protein